MRLKLGYATLEVRLSPRRDLPDEAHGDHKEKSIRVANDLSPVEQVCTLLHELGHETLWRRQLKLDDHLEEQVVEAYAQDLTELLVRNPRLWTWLGERLGRD